MKPFSNLNLLVFQLRTPHRVFIHGRRPFQLKLKKWLFNRNNYKYMRLQMRPLQRFFNVTYMRYAQLYDSLRDSIDQQLEKDKQKYALLNKEGSEEDEFVGILEVFDYKYGKARQFCGKILNLEFYHKVEMSRLIQCADDVSINESHYGFS